MEKTARNPYRLAPTNRLSVVASAVVASAIIGALLVGALVSVLGRGVSTSCVFPRRGPAGKAYDRKQFRKANDDHFTLHTFNNLYYYLKPPAVSRQRGRLCRGVLVVPQWNPAPARLAFNLNTISTAAASMP
jgi:hypothetical protein